MTTLVRQAHAKINLSLAITGKLPNGYHTLQSVMAPLELADTITFEFSDSLAKQGTSIDTLTRLQGHQDRSVSNALPSEENICTRAAKAFLLHPKVRELVSAFPSKIQITIDKKIPMGGGMGGGSSNAAATLLAFAEYFGLKSEVEIQRSVAVKLGADVPFLLQNRPCLCEGIGEILQPLPWAKEWSQKHVYLFCPEFGIPTPWAYNQWDDQSRLTTNLDKSIDFNSLSSIFDNGFNDFETIVFNEKPILKRILNEMNFAGALYSRMSGSGSTLFALCDSEDEISHIEQTVGNLLTREFKNSGCYSIRTTGMRKEALGQHPWNQHEHHRNQNLSSH